MHFHTHTSLSAPGSAVLRIVAIMAAVGIIGFGAWWGIARLRKASRGTLPVVSIYAEVTEGHENDRSQPPSFIIERKGGEWDRPLDVAVYVYQGYRYADEEADFDPIAGHITIPVHQPSAPLPILPRADTLQEGDESVVILIKPGNAYTVGEPSEASVKIIDQVLQGTAPVVRWMNPEEGAAVKTGGMVILMLAVTDEDHDTADVRWCAGPHPVTCTPREVAGYEDDPSVYDGTWDVPAVPGLYQLCAAARDSRGNSSEIACRRVTAAP